MDYSRLTLQQIIDLIMLEIPSKLQIEDDCNILGQEYHRGSFDKQCPFLYNDNKRKVLQSLIDFNPSW